MQKYIEQYKTEYNDFYTKRDKFEEKIMACEKRIEFYRKQQKKLKWVSWVDIIIGGFAKEICDRFNLHYDIYGPFGIGSRTSIYFCKKEKFNICEDRVIKITILPKDLNNGVLHYETGEKTNEFAKGTIGELNGGNNVTKPLPDTIDEIVMLLRGDQELLLEVQNGISRRKSE